MNDTAFTIWAPRLLSLLRIVSGLIFMEHGTQKLLGFGPGPWSLDARRTAGGRR